MSKKIIKIDIVVICIVSKEFQILLSLLVRMGKEFIVEDKQPKIIHSICGDES